MSDEDDDMTTALTEAQIEAWKAAGWRIVKLAPSSTVQGQPQNWVVEDEL